MSSCPEAIYGMHVTRPGEGKCIACGATVGRSAPAARVSKQYDEWEPHIDPLTLEPCDYQEAWG